MQTCMMLWMMPFFFSTVKRFCRTFMPKHLVLVIKLLPMLGTLSLYNMVSLWKLTVSFLHVLYLLVMDRWSSLLRNFSPLLVNNRIKITGKQSNSLQDLCASVVKSLMPLPVYEVPNDEIRFLKNGKKNRQCKFI